MQTTTAPTVPAVASAATTTSSSNPSSAPTSPQNQQQQTPTTTTANNTTPPLQEESSSNNGATNSSIESPEAWKLFVGQIPRNIRHEDLVAQFAVFGDLQEVFIIREQSTGLSKGCCFVRFKARVSAERCIETLNDRVVLPGASHPLQVSYAIQNNGNRSTSPSNNNNINNNNNFGFQQQQQQQQQLQEFEAKLFVGQIPTTFKESDLGSLFEPYGVVREVHIMRHRDTGTSKGAGFVRLEADSTNAKRAIMELNGKILENSTTPIKVDFAHQKQQQQQQQQQANMMMGAARHQQAVMGMMNGAAMMHQPRFPMQAPLMYSGNGAWYPPPPAQMDARKNSMLPKLFVGGLTAHTTEAQLHQIFSHYGQVREVVILKFQNGQSKSSGFVKYATEEEADVAVASLSNRYSLPGSNRPLTVRYAGTANNPPEHKLFVGYLPAHFDEAETENLFRQFGEVTEIHVMRDIRGQTKGSAFVKFAQRPDAEAAIQALNGSTEFGEKPLKVSFALSRSSSPHLGQPPLLQQLAPAQLAHPHQLQAVQQGQRAQQGNAGQQPQELQMAMGYTYTYHPSMHQYFPVSAAAGDGSTLPINFLTN